jgi:hypothetical protein
MIISAKDAMNGEKVASKDRETDISDRLCITGEYYPCFPVSFIKASW